MILLCCGKRGSLQYLQLFLKEGDLGSGEGEEEKDRNQEGIEGRDEEEEDEGGGLAYRELWYVALVTKRVWKALSRGEDSYEREPPIASEFRGKLILYMAMMLLPSLKTDLEYVGRAFAFPSWRGARPHVERITTV